MGPATVPDTCFAPDSQVLFVFVSKDESLRAVLQAVRPSRELVFAPKKRLYEVNHPKIDDEQLVRPVEPHIGITPSHF